MAITRLGKGDFRQPPSDVGRVDGSPLATAFNRMADQIEQNYEQKQELIKQLEQKNMELERFTYTVSRELKSPLVTVNGLIGLLPEDLLELSRVGRVVNPPARFPLARVCREFVKRSGIWSKMASSSARQSASRISKLRPNRAVTVPASSRGTSTGCSACSTRPDNKIPGTGVGLALVKRIVEVHDANIWIESRGDGQGSCFCFTLPIQRGN